MQKTGCGRRRKCRAVGTLASGVAHDFNNLLAAILLHVRLMERQPEAAAEAVPAIGDLAEQGTEVVRELLYFARRESAAPRTIDLVELVRQQEAVLRHLLPDGLELVVELEGEAVPVVADPVGLRRLLVNLVINARDAVEAVRWADHCTSRAHGRAGGTRGRRRRPWNSVRSP